MLGVVNLCVKGRVFVCQGSCICVLGVVYLCVRGRVFASFYDFAIRFLEMYDSVVFNFLLYYCIMDV